MATEVAPGDEEQVYNNTEQRQSVADLSVTFMNAMKFRKKGFSVSKVDQSSVSGCTTGKDSTEEAVCVKLPTRRVSVSTDKSSTKMLLRRRSTFQGLAQSITGMLKLRRLTVPRVEVNKHKIRYENTYKMTPDMGEHIAVSKIEHITEQILADEIGNKEYNSRAAGDMACSISAKIMNRVKEMNFHRYRMLCQVVITEAKEQGLEASSRCLWDASTDNFTTVTYKNNSIAAIAMIYGVYYE